MVCCQCIVRLVCTPTYPLRFIVQTTTQAYKKSEETHTSKIFRPQWFGVSCAVRTTFAFPVLLIAIRSIICILRIFLYFMNIGKTAAHSFSYLGSQYNFFFVNCIFLLFSTDFLMKIISFFASC